MKKLIAKIFNLQVICNHIFDLDKQIRICRCKKCGEKYWYEDTKDVYSKEWERYTLKIVK